MATAGHVNFSSSLLSMKLQGNTLYQQITPFPRVRTSWASFLEPEVMPGGSHFDPGHRYVPNQVSEVIDVSEIAAKRDRYEHLRSSSSCPGPTP